MERFARFLARTVLAADWRLTVALSGEDLYTGLDAGRPGRLAVDPVHWLDETLKGDRQYTWKTILARRRWFRQVRPDVALFIQSSNTPFRSAVVGAWLAGVPIVATHRTMAWPIERTPSRRHCFGLIPGLGLHHRLLMRKTWLTGLLASRIVYNNAAVRQGYEQLYHYPRRKGCVIVNAVEPPCAAMNCRGPDLGDRAHETNGRSPQAVTIGFLGRLGIEKRLDVLVRAMAGLRTTRPVRLAIYGEGPEQEPLAALAAELGMAERVEWCDPTDDVWSAYERCDLVVLCSRRESSSNMVLEAMSAGKAVVVTDVGGLPELIEHGACGVCVPPFDVPALSAVLDRLIDNDAERMRLGARAQQTARLKHDPIAVGQAWLRLLRATALPSPGTMSERPAELNGAPRAAHAPGAS